MDLTPSNTVDLTIDSDDDLLIEAQDASMLQIEISEIDSQLEEIEKNIQSLKQQKELLEARKSELSAELSVKTPAKSSPAQNPAIKCYGPDKTFPWSQKVKKTKKEAFKIASFRPFQLETINATLSKKDVILIMPTGGGKSFCFQLPAIVSGGLTLVVSPLLSLMEDQVSALKALGVRAALLNAASTHAQVKEIHDEMTSVACGLRLLYVTPEKIASSKRFMNKLEKCYEMENLVRIVVDEVHCASQWGHDFRPDYKKLGILRMQFPDVPILGLTATATENVVDDVTSILHIKGCLVFRASFNRTNLVYEVMSKPAGGKEVMESLRNLIKRRFPGQTGIVYCLSRRECESVAFELTKGGVNASAYHAEMDHRERSRVQSNWTRNATDVIVATIAFGMGIDKQDVRFVIHHTISKSVENFYQETGRAGRDGLTAHCILYWRCPDAYRLSSMVFESPMGLPNLYKMLSYSLDPVSCRRCLLARHFSESFNFRQCNRSCDHCIADLSSLLPDDKLSGRPTRVDVTTECRGVLTVIQQATNTGQRATATMVVESWFGGGKPSLRVASVKPPSGFTREQCESMILLMVLENFLEEEFHFTAYSAVSYLRAGRRATALRMGAAKAVFYLPGYVYLNRAQCVAVETKVPPSLPRHTSLSRPKRVVQKADIAYGDDDDDGRPVRRPKVRHLSAPRPAAVPSVGGAEVVVFTSPSPVVDGGAGSVSSSRVPQEPDDTGKEPEAKRNRCKKAPTFSDDDSDTEFDLKLYDSLG